MRMRRFVVLLCGFAPPAFLSVAFAAGSPPAPRYSGVTVTASAFAADDGRVFFGTREGRLELWDLAADRRLRSFTGMRGEISAVAISPDARRVFAADRRGRRALWRTDTGKQIALPRIEAGEVRAAQLSYDGGLLVLVDDRSFIHLIDAAAGRLLRRTPAWPVPIAAIRLSPDGRRLGVTDTSGRFALYDVPGRVRVCGDANIGRAPFSPAVAFSADSRLIAVADDDFRIAIIDVNDCRRLATLEGHRNSVSSMGFSSDGRRLVSVGREAMLKVWDPAQGRALLDRPTLLADAVHARFSADGHRVSAWLAAEGSVWKFLQRWDVESGEAMQADLPFADANLVPAKSVFSLEGTDHGAGAGALPALGSFNSVEGGFSVAMPSDWRRGAPRSSEAGIDIIAPGGGVLPARMVFARVEFSKERIDTYRSVERYIRLFSRPALGWSLIGSEFGPVTGTTIAGRPAMRFDRRVYEQVFTSDDKQESGRVTERRSELVLAYHRHAVIPFEGGFYRLEYIAADAEASRHLRAFEAAVASFRLLDR